MKKSADYTLFTLVLGLFAGALGFEIVGDSLSLNASIAAAENYLKDYVRFSLTAPIVYCIIIAVVVIIGSIFLTKKLHKIELGVCLCGIGIGLFPLSTGVSGMIGVGMLNAIALKRGMTYSFFPAALVYFPLFIAGILICIACLPPMQKESSFKPMNAIGGILTLVCFFALLFISGFSVGFLTIIQLLAIFGAYILFVFFAFKFNLGDFSFSILGPGNGAPSSSSSSSPYKRPAFMESEEKNEPESKPSEVNEPKDDETDWMFHGDN